MLAGVSDGFYGRNPHLAVVTGYELKGLWINHYLGATNGAGFYNAGVGVRPVCPAPNAGASFVFLCHLGGLVMRRWVRWIRQTDPPSTFVTVLYP